tara:strand:- start:5592 stop:6062 length:471 start_codon:yes stop_codon:yes gene_type:complete
MKETILILHNIRSAYNVGAIFRTADAVGVSKIYLTGYTPAPIDRFGRPRKDIAKTALGAEKSVEWEHGDVSRVIQQLNEKEIFVVSVEIDEKAIPIHTYVFPQRVAFVFGNEIRGVSKQLRERSDAIVEIPMRGKKESLNVSVAAGMVLFYRAFSS